MDLYAGSVKTMDGRCIFLLKEVPDRLAFPSIRGIAYDGRNIILGPADLGIWLFNPETEQYRRPTYASAEVKKKSEQDFIDAITTLRNGDHLIMGRDALYLLNGRSYLLSFVDIPAANQNTNFAHQGKDGMVWLTTQRGLHLFGFRIKIFATRSTAWKKSLRECRIYVARQSTIICY